MGHELLGKERGRQPAERLVWPDFVVGPQPSIGELADLVERREKVDIEDRVAVGAVEALDESVLIGLAGLDVENLDAVLFAPID